MDSPTPGPAHKRNESGRTSTITTPEVKKKVTLFDETWVPDDPTLLYDPRFRFPVEELLALSRAFARIPGLAHRRMDSAAVARVFGLEAGLRVGGGDGDGDGGGSSSSAAARGGLLAADAGLLDQHEPGYVVVEPPSSSEAQEELDYVLVGTTDEVERERRREADAEAAFEEGWNNEVRWIEQLLDDADAEEEAAYNA